MVHIGLKLRMIFFPRDVGFQAYATTPASAVSLSCSCVCIIHHLHAHLCHYFNSLPRFATRCLLDYFSHLDSFCAHRLCVDVNGFAPSPPLFRGSVGMDFAVYPSFSCQPDANLQSPRKRETSLMSSLDQIGLCLYL